MSLYRNILRRSWDVTWNNKYLWFFGFFAALIGNGGELEILSKGLSGDLNQGLLKFFRGSVETGLFSSQGLSNMASTFKTDPYTFMMILIFGVLTLALLCFVVWLVIVSQAAIVNNAAAAKYDKKTDFQSNLNSGVRNFWPVLGLNLVMKFFIYLIFGLISLALIMSNLLYGLLFIVFIPIAISVSFIMKYAIGYVVIKKRGFFESIRMGWNLFRLNWLISLEMAFLLYFISIVVGLSLIVLLVILSVPFLLLIVLLQKLASVLAFFVLFGFSIAMFLAIVFIIGALLATFQTTAWSTLFMELEGKGGISKLTRLFGRQ